MSPSFGVRRLRVLLRGCQMRIQWQLGSYFDKLFGKHSNAVNRCMHVTKSSGEAIWKSVFAILRQVSSRLRRHNLPRALDASLSLSEEISAIMRTHPALEHIFHPGVFIRATKNGPQRAYAVGLTSITLGLFGMRLYGTIANLANAVFNRGDIDADRIRQWVHPNR